MNSITHGIDLLAGFAPIITALVGIYVAVIVHRWSKKQIELDRVLYSNQMSEMVNDIIIGDEDYQQIELDNHPIEGLESTLDVKKMYLYFKVLNRGVMHHILSNQIKKEKDLIDARMENLAAITLKDRDFISKHCLPRGYHSSFVTDLEQKWCELENEKNS